MHTPTRRFAVAVLGAAAVGAAVLGGAAVVNSSTGVAPTPDLLTQLTVHRPGDGDTAIPVGPGAVVAKPNGGGTSKPFRTCGELYQAAQSAMEVARDLDAHGRHDDADYWVGSAQRTLNQATNQGCGRG